MSNDFLVEILPAGGDDLRVFLSATNPPLNRRPIRRQRITIACEKVEALRRGDSLQGLTDEVRDKISEWLLEGEMTGYLDSALKNQNGDPIRLIFSVDEELLPMLADLPVELLYFEGGWFALQPKVGAIIHQLQKTSDISIQPGTLDWPLRVLIVRSNPTDLGGAVPEAATICDRLIEMTKDLGRNMVLVDLLSREAGLLEPAPKEDHWPNFRRHLRERKIQSLEPPTWENFRKYLKKTHYSILIFLGHGNLPDSTDDLPSPGELAFETSDGESDHITAVQLKYELQTPERAVPVVMLVGCLTAARFKELEEEKRTAILGDIPKMIRSSQGVAQALVSSEAGVHFAVGMRYKLEMESAVEFLKAFFESLLKIKPGYVEAAVRAGRAELFANLGPYPPSWSAPVIFRTSGKEPLLDFLAKWPKYEITPIDLRDQEYRELAWGWLVKQPGLPLAYEVLKKAETDLKDRALQKGAVMLPDRIELKVGETAAPLFITLHGTLAARQVIVSLSIAGEHTRFKSLQSTQALKQSGYKLLNISEAGSPRISFTLEWTKDTPPTPLPQEQLVQAEIEIGESSPACLSVSIELETVPPRIVRTMSNAVIMSPPV